MTSSIAVHGFMRELNDIFLDSKKDLNKQVVENKINQHFESFVKDTKKLSNKQQIVQEATEYKNNILSDLDNIIIRNASH